MKPRRIQLRRTKGWRKPPGAIVVSRPSRWGNPYVLERRDDWHEGGVVLIVDSRDGTIEDFAGDEHLARNIAVLQFREELQREREVRGSDGRVRFTVTDVRRELRGKDLCCWCPEGHPCHADVLLEVANV